MTPVDGRSTPRTDARRPPLYKKPLGSHVEAISSSSCTQITGERASTNGERSCDEMRGLLVVALLLASAAWLAEGAGECGETSPDRMALKLAPCASAAQNPSSAPSSGCCSAVSTIGKQSRECLCAVMLSKTARSAGIKPEVAITIPKRCNIADRPVGYKCGDYTLP